MSEYDYEYERDRKYCYPDSYILRNKLGITDEKALSTADEMPVRLTYYFSEINVLHPFREGNGRTQRVFIEYLAQCDGYYVDFSDVSSKEMIEASTLSFDKDYGKMVEMFRRILSPITPQEQQAFHKKMGVNFKGEI